VYMIWAPGDWTFIGRS